MRFIAVGVLLLAAAGAVAAQGAGVAPEGLRPSEDDALRDVPPAQLLNPSSPIEEGSHAVKIPAQRLDTKPGALRSSRPAAAPDPPPAARRSAEPHPGWASGPALTPEEIRAAVQAQEEAEAKARAQGPAAPPAPRR